MAGREYSNSDWGPLIPYHALFVCSIVQLFSSGQTLVKLGGVGGQMSRGLPLEGDVEVLGKCQYLL